MVFSRLFGGGAWSLEFWSRGREEFLEVVVRSRHAVDAYIHRVLSEHVPCCRSTRRRVDRPLTWFATSPPRFPDVGLLHDRRCYVLRCSVGCVGKDNIMIHDGLG